MTTSWQMGLWYHQFLEFMTFNYKQLFLAWLCFFSYAQI